MATVALGCTDAFLVYGRNKSTKDGVVSATSADDASDEPLSPSPGDETAKVDKYIKVEKSAVTLKNVALLLKLKSNL